MKKTLRIALCLALCAVLVLACACGKKAEEPAADDTASVLPETNEVVVDEAAEPTFDELIEAAKGEEKLVVYGTHSDIEDVAALFSETYGVEVEFTQLGDADLVDKVTAECEAETANGADLVFIQDSARVMGNLVANNYVTNYYNSRIQGIVGEDACEPLLECIYCVKTVVYNNEVGTSDMWNNLWAFTDEKNAGLFQMKDPTLEGVNMNFYTMITRDENAEMLAGAYEDYFGEALVLDDDCPNAGYQWIKNVYNNGLVLGTSDTSICENVGAKGQDKPLVGLFTINKYAARVEKDLAVAYNEETEPFLGFYYPIYALLTSNCDSPNAAQAFIEFMYTEDAWQFFTRIGDYSASDALNETRVGVWEEGAWNLEELANMYVLEDPEWVYSNRVMVEDFITSLTY